MTTRYRIEIKQVVITPVIVTANTKQEAMDQVFQQQGEAGDCYYTDEIEIVFAEKMED